MRTFTVEDMIAMFRHGVDRGIDVATAYDWGSTTSQKERDDLICAFYDVINDGKPVPEWEDWEKAEALVDGGLKNGTRT